MSQNVRKKHPEGCLVSLHVSRLQQAVVVFDDLSFVDVQRKFVSLRQAGEGSGEFLVVDGDVSRDGRLSFDGFLDDLQRAGLDESDDVSDFAEIGRDVDFLAVHGNVAMVDQLAGSGAGAGESHAIDEVVQTGFQDAEEGQAGNGVFFLGQDEEAAELTFGNAIEFAELLLLDELLSVFGRFALPVLTMLARPIGALFQFVAGLRDGKTKTAGLFPSGFGVSRHYMSPFFALRQSPG